MLTGAEIVSGSWRQKQKSRNILKIAASSGKVIESPGKLNLRPLGVESDTERGDRFWNRNVVEMKFSIEHDWMKRVRFAESKPNYGMRELDPVPEELTGNKLELIGPMLDGFIKEIGLLIHAKLGRSRMTGLMAPVVLFMPFQIFRHLWVLHGTRLWQEH